MDTRSQGNKSLTRGARLRLLTREGDRERERGGGTLNRAKRNSIATNTRVSGEKRERILDLYAEREIRMLHFR